MLIDITGNRYGRLTVISRNERPGHIVYWNCICDCGNTHIAAGAQLKNGHIRSCGCLHNELSAERAKNLFTKHNGHGTRLYSIWCSMRTRCNNPNTKNYKDYGGRGIKVCSEWNDFVKFRDWAMSNGYNNDLTLDRINVNGNYEPDNCRWATLDEQSNNKRTTKYITINGETHSLKEWSNISGICYSILTDRVKSGWDSNKLLTPTKL